MTVEKGFKVVGRSRGLLCSAYWSLGYGGVEYKVGEETHPRERCGPLCVFEDIAPAQKFAMSGDLVFECEFQRSVDQSRAWIAVDYLPVQIGHQMSLARNTVLADWVRIGRQVQ